MQIVIETSKWSFRKRVKTEQGFETAFLSPIPTPFNYGFIEDTEGEDGAPLDIVVLGPKLDTGTRPNLGIIGRVKFIDDSKEDDKYIATTDGHHHETAIKIFFTLYAFSKLILGLIHQRQITKNSFNGVEWYETEVKSASDIQNCSNQLE